MTTSHELMKNKRQNNDRRDTAKYRHDKHRRRETRQPNRIDSGNRHSFLINKPDSSLTACKKFMM